jgi:hypothetical protein
LAAINAALTNGNRRTGTPSENGIMSSGRCGHRPGEQIGKPNGRGFWLRHHADGVYENPNSAARLGINN